MSRSSPVILLAFANDRIGDGAGYLNLPEERRALEDVLDPATDAGVTLVVETNATTERLFDALDAYNDRIIGLHFGGHATGESLTLEGRRGEPRALLSAGLALRIGRLPDLRWLCLNGCGTAPQIEAVHAHSAVPVVATSTAIRDDAAVRFARRFYSGLATGATVGEAFAQAESEQLAEAATPDAVRRAGADDAPLRMMRPTQAPDRPWPWVLVPRAGDEARLEATIFEALPAAPSGARRLDGRWAIAAGLVVAALALGGWWWANRCDPLPAPMGPTLDGALTDDAGWRTGPDLAARHRPGDMVQWYETTATGEYRALPAAVPFMWSDACFPGLEVRREPLRPGADGSARLGPEATRALVGAAPPEVLWLSATALEPTIEVVGKSALSERFSQDCVSALDRALARGARPEAYATLTEVARAAGIQLEIGWRCDVDAADRQRVTAALAGAVERTLGGAHALDVDDRSRTTLRVDGRLVLGWKERPIGVVTPPAGTTP